MTGRQQSAKKPRSLARLASGLVLALKRDEFDNLHVDDFDSTHVPFSVRSRVVPLREVEDPAAWRVR